MKIVTIIIIISIFIISSNATLASMFAYLTIKLLAWERQTHQALQQLENYYNNHSFHHLIIIIIVIINIVTIFLQSWVQKEERRQKRKEFQNPAPQPDPAHSFPCPQCNRLFRARIGLISHLCTHPPTLVKSWSPPKTEDEHHHYFLTILGIKAYRVQPDPWTFWNAPLSITEILLPLKSLERITQQLLYSYITLNFIQDYH